MTEELGNYVTSYFIMNLPNSALEILNMSDKHYAVFFHEYIHFLQDITTFYGYNGIYSHGEYIRRALNDIYTGPKQFDVPLNIEERGDNVLLNKNIAIFSLGDKEEIDFVKIKKCFIEDFQLTNNFSIHELHVKAWTDNLEGDEIIVGAYAIRESMAYMLEKNCTTKYRTSKDFPYAIVRLIADEVCPNMLSDLDLIALCDVSLQYSLPGYALYESLRIIADGNIVIKQPEDVYKFFLSQHVNFMGQSMSMSQALKRASQLAEECLLSYVKMDTLKNEYQEKIKHTMNYGINVRLNQPYFFLKMARSGLDKENKMIREIIAALGSPQIVGRAGVRHQIPTSGSTCRFEYLEVVKDIENLFQDAESTCSLKQWCNGIVDNRCDYAPWKRCKDKQLCPYGAMWKHWALSDFEPNL